MAMLMVIVASRGQGSCRSCGRVVTWFEMAKSGKRMPFDGHVTFADVHQGSDGREIGHVDGQQYPTHFATCPQAKDWRRA